MTRPAPVVAIVMLISSTAIASPAGTERAPLELTGTAFVPTAATLGEGRWAISLHEGILVGLAYGVTDALQLNLTGTYVPEAEGIVLPAARLELGALGDVRFALFGGLGIDIPVHGRLGYLPGLGAVATHCGLLDGNLCASGVLVAAAPASPRGLDGIVDVALTGGWRVASSVVLLAEIHLRSIVPEPQAGLTVVAAARVTWGPFSADLGWMIDAGLGGPALPLIGPPGFPVVNLGLVLEQEAPSRLQPGLRAAAPVVTVVTR